MPSELMELQYLGRSQVPLWGGHLKRGEPVTDPTMRSWIERGWIEAIGTEGYVLTDAGRKFCQQEMSMTDHPPTHPYLYGDAKNESERLRPGTEHDALAALSKALRETIHQHPSLAEPINQVARNITKLMKTPGDEKLRRQTAMMIESLLHAIEKSSH